MASTHDRDGREHLGFRGFRTVERPSADLVRRLAAYAPPDLSDAMNGGYTLDPASGLCTPFGDESRDPPSQSPFPGGPSMSSNSACNKRTKAT